ncbi:hypothetical protein O9K51_03651 [Purpureocillium lavendulum]|uniref:BAH domain-containing protein n=1 Tax=Purpureocillium lavendulum TaxID=1247861 RepID=A0AB34FUZ7_9HYPO|nr:hypothetical protein O9K51_03651 [Purpureocillium lavendulum]
MKPATGQRRRKSSSKARAQCPFSVVILSTKRKRKRDARETEHGLLQRSPFEPKGKFSTHDTLDLAYVVEPHKRWSDMTRYSSFILNSVKYYNEEFVYVATDRAIARQRAINVDSEPHGLLQLTDCWVAKLLEIRARDQHHVYARVCWMYSPDDLPSSALGNNKLSSGRQPYHGQNELIASNHSELTHPPKSSLH